MKIWRKGKGEEKEKVEREESGKLVNIQLSKKSGEPILGFTSPKGEDQARKLREQAEDLRNMARKLERIAGEMEGSAPGGKAVRLVRKVFQREGQKKAK
jgi:hypothetical protein